MCARAFAPLEDEHEVPNLVAWNDDLIRSRSVQNRPLAKAFLRRREQRPHLRHAGGDREQRLLIAFEPIDPIKRPDYTTSSATGPRLPGDVIGLPWFAVP